MLVGGQRERERERGRCEEVKLTHSAKRSSLIETHCAKSKSCTLTSGLAIRYVCLRPQSHPLPRNTVFQTRSALLSLVSLSPFFDFFPTSLISLRARRNQGISTLPRENARSLLSHPLSSCSQERASRQAGRQRQTRPDRTSPGRQAGLSHSFLPTTRCRGGGRSIGLARREREDGNFETASRRVSTRRERETLTPLTSRKARGKGRTRGDDDDVTMCSPSKRREMDVMKLYVLPLFRPKTHRATTLTRIGSSLSLSRPNRLMSDFNVQVENDNIQEFFVNFEGPKDSECLSPSPFSSLLCCR